MPHTKKVFFHNQRIFIVLSGRLFRGYLRLIKWQTADGTFGRGTKQMFNDELLQTIKLRPLTEDDAEHVLVWSKDDLFCLANGWETNRTTEELKQWWFNCINHPAEDFIRMGVEVNQKLAGYADVAFIKDGTAEFGIAIGDSKLWGKGVGYHSSLAMIRYAAKNLGIHTFDAETHEANTRSQRMLEKIGFKEISRIGGEQYLGTHSQLIQYRLKIEPSLSS